MANNLRLSGIYHGMMYRCYNPKCKSYKDYGARGITVCEEWRNDKQAFIDWAYANGYKDELSIDRIDNDGNYNPWNCRWVTIKQQVNNRRCNFYIKAFGTVKTASEWGEIIGLDRKTLVNRIKGGMEPKKALTTPCMKNGKVYRPLKVNLLKNPSCLREPTTKGENLRRYISTKMRSEEITQVQMADELAITQSAFSQKLRKAQFSYSELVMMFRKLHSTTEEITRLF